MSTWGDRKSSRWRTRRMLKRIVQTGLIVTALFGVIVAIVLAVLTSESAWKRFVFPRLFGPYWDTALSWESFEPRLFPLGLKIERLNLHEPNASDEYVIRVDDFDLELSWGSLFGDIDVREVSATGVYVSYKKFDWTESNLTRAVDRLYEGRKLSDRRSARTSDEFQFPEISAPGFGIDGFELIYENLMNPSNPIKTVYVTTSPVEFEIPPGRGGRSERMLTDLVEIRSEGRVSIETSRQIFRGAAELDLSIPDLKDFPANRATGTMSVASLSDPRYFLSMEGEFPLEKAPFRVSSIVSEKLRIALHTPLQPEPLVLFRNGYLDPFSGELNGRFSVVGRSNEILAAMENFMPEDMAAEARDTLERTPGLEWAYDSSAAFDFSTSVTLAGTGIMQYAILGEEERRPLTLRADGILRANDVAITELDELVDRIRIRSPLAVTGGRFTADASLFWNLKLDQAAGVAEVFARTRVRPTFLTEEDFEVVLTVSDPEDTTKPIFFNPWSEGWMERAGQVMGEPAEMPRYQVMAYWEEALSNYAPSLRAWSETLDAMKLFRGRIALEATLKSGSFTAELIAPFFEQVREAGNGRVDLSYTRIDSDLPARWRAGLGATDIRIDGIPDAVRIDGAVEVVQSESRLTASELSLHVGRGNERDVPGAFEFSLPGIGPNGELGPTLPTYVDLRSGESHFELSATTIRREVIEVLFRVQTFNLSEQLAQPLYRRILTMLGFEEDGGSDGARADIYMVGDLGPTIRLASDFRIGGVPVAGFLMLPKDSSVAGDTFDVSLLQAASLDRNTALLRPEEFDFQVYQADTSDPFLHVSLESDEDAAFDYRTLSNFAVSEATRIASTTPATNMRQVIARTFARVDRFEQALVRGGGQFVFSIPGFEIAEWSTTLSGAGVPLESGRLEAKLVADLDSESDGLGTSAKGEFSVSNLTFAGVERPIPLVNGEVELKTRGAEVILDILRTSLDLAEGYQPTTVRFQGNADTNTFESNWNLKIDHVNGAVLNVLERMEKAGIAQSAGILQSLPTRSLAAVGTESAQGEVGLDFNASTNAAGDELLLRTIQTGTDLPILGHLLDPLRFRLEQRLRLVKGASPKLENLEGWVREQSADHALLELTLSEPIVFGEEDQAGTSARIELKAYKDLADLRERLSQLPIPLFDRTIVGGIIHGTFTTTIPAGRLVPKLMEARAVNDLTLMVEGLELSDYEPKIDGELTGRLEKKEGAIALTPLRFKARHGGDNVGEFVFDANYRISENTFDARLNLIDLRPILLRAMPERFSRWASGESSRLNLRAELTAALDTMVVELDVALRARELALPPVRLRDGFDYAAPPLNLDLDFTSSYDNVTSQVLVSRFDTLLTKGTLSRGDRLSRLNPEISPVFSARQAAPVLYNLQTNSISPVTPEGVGLDATLGPIDMSDFGPLFLRLYGIPLSKGTLVGSMEIRTEGSDAMRRDSAKVELELNEGAWKRLDGETDPIEARFSLEGELLPGVIRLEDATLRLMFPQDTLQPEDNLTLAGFLERSEGMKKAELDISSTSLRIGRIVRFAKEMGLGAGESSDAEELTVSEGVPSIGQVLEETRTWEAQVNGNLENVRYREVAFPSIRMSARIQDNVARLDQLRSRLTGGDILMTGEANLDDPELPWSADLAISRLNITPWVQSFTSPARFGSVLGRLSARLEAQGSGVTIEKLGQNLEGRASIELRQFNIDNSMVQRLVGVQKAVDADGELMLRNNVARLRIDTPWHPEFSLLVQGVARPILPARDEETHFRSLLRYARNSAVGPEGRTMYYRGKQVPFRQELYGVLLEAEGELKEGAPTEITVRSLYY